ncbi:hypothetical protein T484DRAFT_1841508 [Baffinella frigidus]|nr:hypothetical protein T484DRAFT_1841508 [Cryptophyta sp. CCMP2293]
MKTDLSPACDCNRKDVRDAVEAAAGAAKGWSSKPGHTRAQILYFLAENLSARAAAFAARVAQITGGTLSEAEAEITGGALAEAEAEVAAAITGGSLSEAEAEVAAAVDRIITGGSLSEAEAEVAAAVDRIFTYAALADKAGGTVQESTLKGMVMAVNESVGSIAIGMVMAVNESVGTIAIGMVMAVNESVGALAIGMVMAVNESVGAIGIVCPTAHPLLSLVSLLAAAVARGNAVVLIPARAAALLASDLYQVPP